MGCLNDKPAAKVPSKPTPGSSAGDEYNDEKSFKLLLLGAGGSGKSTVFRQVKILYGGGYDEDERQTLKITIHQNMVQCMKKIVDMAPRYGTIEDAEIVSKVSKLSDDGPYRELEQIGEMIETLWKDPGVKKIYAARSNYQLPTDTIHYFFEKAKTVMTKEYLPSQDDLLYCRIHSTGVKTENFSMGDNLKFRLLDVGGQRSERKKWVRCFENVTAVLYVVAISEYDQLCYEDNETNRVLEALDLFEDIANSEWFADIDIILFLNKKDLLAEKLKHVPPFNFFTDFKGNGDYDSMISFLKTEFDERNQQEREVKVHVTCATDSDDIQNVFENQVKTILQTKLKAKMV